jgi:hypothetical protein
MSVKVTVPNTSSDSVVFGSANTPTAAEVVGIDSGSSNGQLAFKTTAGGTSTERMRIDSAGSLLIGTTSASTTPAAKIEAYGTDSSIICHYNTQSRGGIAALSSQRVAVTTTVAGDDIVFGYGITSAGFVENVRIDNTTGAVTKPYHPSFTGWRTAGNVSNTNVVLHNNIITNVGSYYNASTGRFTCPVAGKYLVICDGHAENSNPHEHAIYKNGSAVCYAYENGATYGRATQSAILDCAANDYIQHYVTNGTFWGGNNSGLKMTITLIG